MSRIVVTVCDVCEGQDDVLSYEIKRKGAKGRPVQRDFCRVHGEPLESVLVGTAPKAPTKRAATKKTAAKKATSSRSSRVTTLAEIEKLKAT